MGLLPTAADFDLVSFQTETQPGRTYKLDFGRSRVRGMTDGQEAVRQAAYLILNVERYAYPIYSRSYGVELSSLSGMPRDYAMSECKRRITEALTQDSRITSLSDWSFEAGPKSVWVRCTAHTIYGEIALEKEAAI